MSSWCLTSRAPSALTRCIDYCVIGVVSVWCYSDVDGSGEGKPPFNRVSDKQSSFVGSPVIQDAPWLSLTISTTPGHYYLVSNASRLSLMLANRCNRRPNVSRAAVMRPCNNSDFSQCPCWKRAFGDVSRYWSEYHEVTHCTVIAEHVVRPSREVRTSESGAKVPGNEFWHSTITIGSFIATVFTVICLFLVDRVPVSCLDNRVNQ